MKNPSIIPNLYITSITNSLKRGNGLLLHELTRLKKTKNVSSLVLIERNYLHLGTCQIISIPTYWYLTFQFLKNMLNATNMLPKPWAFWVSKTRRKRIFNFHLVNNILYNQRRSIYLVVVKHLDKEICL